jgi:hypothetical protein
MSSATAIRKPETHSRMAGSKKHGLTTAHGLLRNFSCDIEITRPMNIVRLLSTFIIPRNICLYCVQTTKRTFTLDVWCIAQPKAKGIKNQDMFCVSLDFL